MPGSSNSGSFIPKQRDAAPRRKRNTKNQIFIFSVIAYSLLFAALLSAGGIFIYTSYQNTVLTNEAGQLAGEITTFSVRDLNEVRDFDILLKQATERVDSTASMVAVLEAVEKTVIESVQLDSMSIERRADAGLVVTAGVTTDSFDPVRFQRDLLESDPDLFQTVEITNLQIGAAASAESEEVTVSSTDDEVSFELVLTIPLTEVRYDPASARLTDEVFEADEEVVSEIEDTTESTNESTDSAEVAITEETSV